MAAEPSNLEKVLILVKALPHPGHKHGETVCCAGVTPELEWRRMFPIRFRHLENKFKRWDWVTYRWSRPSRDRRMESRHVHEESIDVGDKLAPPHRARFLKPLFVDSTDEAAKRKQSLALVRPISPRFWYEKKTPSEIEDERQAYIHAASQMSFLDQELKALKPCPYRFKLDYQTVDGKRHKVTCGDWETVAMFRKFRRISSESKALLDMEKTFNEEYPKRGMALAMGTHSARASQWLLVGIIRVDPDFQETLF